MIGGWSRRRRGVGATHMQDDLDALTQAGPMAGVRLRRLFGPLDELRGGVLRVLLLSLLLQLMLLPGPVLVQWLVDEVLLSADRDLLAVIGLGMVLLVVLQVLSGITYARSEAHLASLLGQHGMRNVFAHLLDLPPAFFESRNTRDIALRLDAMQSVRRTLAGGCIGGLANGLPAALAFGLMLAYGGTLALPALSAAVLYAGFRSFCWRRLGDAADAQLEAEARQQQHQHESLQGITELKVAGVEAGCRERHDRLAVATVESELRAAQLRARVQAARRLLFGVERIVVIWLGVLLVLQQVISAGALLAFLLLRELFVTRMGALVDAWIELRMLRLQAERLADILLAPAEHVAAMPAVSPMPAVRIEAENLSFRYSADGPWVLRDCSFSIGIGEVVAITGTSGAGKTTLAKILLGLLEPTSGCLRVAGQESAALGSGQLRAVSAAVMQGECLFSGSVADNISLFDPVFDRVKVETAARLAALHEDIVALPLGYHGRVGEAGCLLSSTQKRRLVLARALYRQPGLLVLDEVDGALAGQDGLSVGRMLEPLRLTRVLVSHHPDTLAGADRILVIEQGRIAREWRPDRRRERDDLVMGPRPA